MTPSRRPHSLQPVLQSNNWQTAFVFLLMQAINRATGASWARSGPRQFWWRFEVKVPSTISVTLHQHPQGLWGICFAQQIVTLKKGTDGERTEEATAEARCACQVILIWILYCFIMPCLGSLKILVKTLPELLIKLFFFMVTFWAWNKLPKLIELPIKRASRSRLLFCCFRCISQFIQQWKMTSIDIKA